MRILIVVDMQNDFVSGSLGSNEAQIIVPDVIEKINEYNNEDDFIFFTMDTHESRFYMSSEEGKNLPIAHCIKDTDGHKLVPEIYDITFKTEPFIGEKITFGSLALGNKLNDLDHITDIESIELCGLCTDICVISNAMIAKAACPNVPIYVDPTCCAGTTPKAHQKAIELMRDSLQIHIIGD